MSALAGYREQQILLPKFYFPGTSAAGANGGATTGRLVLPSACPRSYVFLQNVSDTTMWWAQGAGRAACTIANGAVNAVSVVNGGFNFTLPPRVVFLGGGRFPNGLMEGLGYPDQTSPSKQAKAHAVLAAGVITSIVIDDGGAGYVSAPYVQLIHDQNDPYGCTDPSAGGGFGNQLYSGQSMYEAHSIVCTDALAVYFGTTGKAYTCDIMM